MRGSHRYVFFAKARVFRRQGRHLAPESPKWDKTNCQKPGDELGIRELGMPNLDKSSQAEQKPSVATKREKRAYPRKRGTFERTEGLFLEISSTKIVKCMFFMGRRYFLREVVFQGRYFMGQSQINKGAKDRKSRVMSLAHGKDRLIAK